MEGLRGKQPLKKYCKGTSPVNTYKFGSIGVMCWRRDWTPWPQGDGALQRNWQEGGGSLILLAHVHRLLACSPLLAWAGEGSSWLAFFCWKALWESVNQGLTSAEDGGGQWKDAGRLASQQCLCQCGSRVACLPEPTRGAWATSIRQLGPPSALMWRPEYTYLCSYPED